MSRNRGTSALTALTFKEGHLLARLTLLLACTAGTCTPIEDVRPPTQTDSAQAGAGARERERGRDPSTTGGAGSGSDPSVTLGSGVAATSTPCAPEGARACAAHGVREVSVCANGVWTADTPCKESERCESQAGAQQGSCLAIPAICSGQEPGVEFCDGEERKVCDDLVSAREVPCAAMQSCLRAAGGKAVCECMPGALPNAAGGCDMSSGCACDKLTECAVTASGEPTCTPCPGGYVGDGKKGCVPQLELLSFSCGQLSPALTSGVYAYHLRAPLLCQRLQLMATAPDKTHIEIDGAPLLEGATWMSDLLTVGDSAVKIVVTADSGPSSTYLLEVEREGAQADYIKASNPQYEDSFGFSISMDRDTLVVGAPFEDSDARGVNGDQANDRGRDSGAAYVFVRQGDSWVQQAYLKSDAPAESDFAATSVAVSGDLIVIGAIRFNPMAFKILPPTSPGIAYVYARQGTTWALEGKLNPTPGAGADLFGFHVAIQGETVLVGAPYDSTMVSHGGAVYSFARSNGVWMQQQKLIPAKPIAESSFGISCALDGDTLVAGAMQDPSRAEAAGSAYFFTRSAGLWSEQQRVEAGQPKELGTFGMAVAIRGERAVISAPGLDLRQRPTPPGEVYLFERSTGSWQQKEVFHAAVPRSVDLFGGSVALTDSAIIIGANGDASGSRGAAGDPTSTSSPLSGAAYVFGQQNSSWVQSAYLKALNGEAEDGFGHSVSATGDTIAFGAPFEASSTSGINPAGESNDAFKAGAVYVFH